MAVTQQVHCPTGYWAEVMTNGLGINDYYCTY
jgi:hypothetical protein